MWDARECETSRRWVNAVLVVTGSRRTVLDCMRERREDPAGQKVEKGESQRARGRLGSDGARQSVLDCVDLLGRSCRCNA